MHRNTSVLRIGRVQDAVGVGTICFGRDDAALLNHNLKSLPNGTLSAQQSRMKSIQTALTNIESKIYFIRGQKVMLDFDLAELYQVPTKRLKEQVKRNLKRFPSDFMFILTEQELTNLRSQFATSSLSWGGHRYLPFAFIEQGVAMLSSVLQSERAIHVNIAIMRAFVHMREILISNKEFEIKLNELEEKYENHDIELQVVFEAIRKLRSIQSTPRKRIIGLGEKDK